MLSLGSANLLAAMGEIAVLVVVFSAFALFFIVAIGNRTDTDPSGSRPMAAYLFSGAFLFLWVTYIGIDAAANSIIQAIGNHPGQSFNGIYYGPNYTNTVIRSCVLAGILIVFAGGAYVLHLSRGNALADAESDPSGPTKRIMRSYVALVSFLTIIIVVLALMVAVWLVCALISPTIFLSGNANRTATVRAICDMLVLIVLAGGIFTFHQRFAPDHLRLLSMGGRGSHSGSTRDEVSSPPSASPPPAPSTPTS